jgi:hypothetical protein
MDAATLDSLQGFLSGSTAPRIRTAAAAAIAAATAGEGNAASRAAAAGSPVLLRRLLALRGDAAAGRLALSALINLAEDQDAAKELVRLRAVSLSALALLDPDQHEFATLYTALLANLTRYPEGVSALVGDAEGFGDNERRLAEATLLRLAAHLRSIPNALFMANACSSERGRAVLLSADDNDPRMQPLNSLLELLRDEDKDKRLAAASALRNCALAESSHRPLVQGTDVLGVALARLMSASHPLTPEELLATPKEVRNAAAAPLKLKPEPYAEIRLMITEAFLLLCKTREGRDALRSSGAYPVLREWHLQEDDESVKEAMEQIVDRTQLLQDETAVGST